MQRPSHSLDLLCLGSSQPPLAGAAAHDIRAASRWLADDVTVGCGGDLNEAFVLTAVLTLLSDFLAHCCWRPSLLPNDEEYKYQGPALQIARLLRGLEFASVIQSILILIDPQG